MGQRSQIYVYLHDGKQGALIAKYYQWNYGLMMLAHLHSIVSMVQFNADRVYDLESLAKIAEIGTNTCNLPHDFIGEMRWNNNHNILKEFNEWTKTPTKKLFKEFVFLGQENNDGQLYIDIEHKIITGQKNTVICKYAFLDNELRKIMNYRAYMAMEYTDTEITDSLQSQWNDVYHSLDLLDLIEMDKTDIREFQSRNYRNYKR